MNPPSCRDAQGTFQTRRRSLGTFARSCVALVLGLRLAFADPVPNSATSPRPERQLLVKCVGGPSGDVARAADIAVGATRVRSFHALGWHLVEVPDALSVGAAMARYRSQPGVLFVEPNAALSSEPPLPVGAANRESGMANGGDDPDSGSPPQERNPTRHSPFAIPDPQPPGVIPNDPRFREQWNLRIIGMTNAWAVTTGSSNMVVAVLDSGIDYNHDDLRDNMWRNPGETGLDILGRDKASNGVDDDVNGYADDVYGIDVADNDSDPMDLGSVDDPLRHGTAVAGVIGASGSNAKGITGINWHVRIMAIRMFPFDGRRGASRAAIAYMVAAIDYVVSMKQRGINVRVINHSGFTLVESDAVRESLRLLATEGILFVCSAGNQTSNTDIHSSWPRNYDLPFLISVAASTSTDALIDYSNFGRTTVDLAAPTIVPSTGRASGYITDFPGTSAASPHVAGAAALLFAAKPEATLFEIKGALMKSVDSKPAFLGKMASNGRLNVLRAMAVLTNTSLPPVVIGAFPGSSRSRTDAPIELWFDKPMERGSVEAALQLRPEVVGTFEWSDGDRVVKLRHTEPLVRTNYTCRLLGSARDASGITLDGDFDRVAEGSSVDDFVWGFAFGPSNDEPSAATPIANREGSISGTTRNSDPESEEPLATGFNYSPLSVWYAWTAPESGWTTFEVGGSSPTDFVAAVYAGSSLAETTRAAFNDNAGSFRYPRLTWFAMQSQTYLIDVAGKVPIDGGTIAAGSGDFTLRWYPTPPPGITGVDPFTAMPGSVVTLNGTNFTGVTRVLFNGAEAQFTTLTNTHNFHDRRLTAVVPANATTGPITVETPHGNGTSTMSFDVPDGRPPALLAAIESNGTLALSWPASAAGYVLEASRVLGPSAWVPVGLPIETAASRSIVRIVVTGPAQFYRLRQP